MKKFSLVYALLIMGFTAIISQVILIRELIVTFSGNELSIGIFFANWLILEAAGSFLAGRLAMRFKSEFKPYVTVQLIIALILPILIYLARIAKIYLYTVPGEGISISTIFFVSFILLTPIGLLNGAQFSFGSRLLSGWTDKSATTIGKVYIYESIGSIFGGLAATYICLQNLNTIQSAFILSLLNILSTICLLFFASTQSQKADGLKFSLLKTISTLLFFILAVSILSGADEHIHNQSIDRQWPGYKIISHKNSIFGNVALIERANQYDLLSNGIPILSLPTPDIAHIEDVVHFPLLFHPNPQNIFLLGGGIGGVINEILKHPIRSVDYAELDPLLIETVENFAPDSLLSELKSEKVHVHYIDGRYFLRNTHKKYDVIIINLPDPSTLELNRFYTDDFFKICAEHLSTQGILIFQIPAAASYMNEPLRRLNTCLLNTVSAIFTARRVIPFEKNLVLASGDAQVLKIDSDLLIKRFHQRQIKARMFSEPYIIYKLDARRTQWYHEQLELTEPVSINSDMKPSALYYDMLYWNSLLSPGFTDFYHWFEDISIGYHILLIALAFLIIFMAQRIHRPYKKVYILSSVFTSGFSGMALTIIIVLFFQTFYGYVYLWIGLIISAFMVGLTGGSIWSNRWKTDLKKLFSLFLQLEYLFVIYFGLLTIFFFFLDSRQIPDFFQSIPQYIVLLITLFCGTFVGIQFPLANKLYLDDPHKLTKTAGIIYAVDLMGAWAAGMIVTLILIPIVGIFKTCVLLLFIKTGSTLVFKFARK
jgi:spermidine synthase